MNDAHATIEKKGETPIQVTLSRSGLSAGKPGLVVHVKTLPAIEALVRSLGSEEAVPVRDFGRGWLSLNGQPLMAYTTRLNGQLGTSPHFYRLDQLGTSLCVNNREDREKFVNLGFLRLVGTSDGISFGLPDVYDRDFVNQLASDIQRALAAFYKSFAKPFNISVSLSTQEW